VISVLAETIVERELEYREADKAIHTILRISKPVFNGSEFECSWQIEGWKDSRIKKSFGEDSLQALLLAMEVINIDTKHAKGKFYSYEKEFSILPRDLTQGYIPE